MSEISPSFDSLHFFEEQLSEIESKDLKKYVIHKTSEGLYELQNTSMLRVKFWRWITPEKYNTEQNISDILSLLDQAFKKKEKFDYTKLASSLQHLSKKTDSRITRILLEIEPVQIDFYKQIDEARQDIENDDMKNGVRGFIDVLRIKTKQIAAAKKENLFWGDRLQSKKEELFLAIARKTENFTLIDDSQKISLGRILTEFDGIGGKPLRSKVFFPLVEGQLKMLQPVGDGKERDFSNHVESNLKLLQSAQILNQKEAKEYKKKIVSVIFQKFNQIEGLSLPSYETLSDSLKRFDQKFCPPPLMTKNQEKALNRCADSIKNQALLLEKKINQSIEKVQQDLWKNIKSFLKDIEEYGAFASFEQYEQLLGRLKNAFPHLSQALFKPPAETSVTISVQEIENKKPIPLPREDKDSFVENWVSLFPDADGARDNFARVEFDVISIAGEKVDHKAYRSELGEKFPEFKDPPSGEDQAKKLAFWCEKIFTRICEKNPQATEEEKKLLKKVITECFVIATIQHNPGVSLPSDVKKFLFMLSPEIPYRVEAKRSGQCDINIEKLDNGTWQATVTASFTTSLNEKESEMASCVYEATLTKDFSQRENDWKGRVKAS